MDLVPVLSLIQEKIAAEEAHGPKEKRSRNASDYDETCGSIGLDFYPHDAS